MRGDLTLLFAVASVLACAGPGDSPQSLNQAAGNKATGLEGTVRRGPITPVCRLGVPCDAPFSAAFQILLAQRVVARFQSDSAGHYRVLLPPGLYTVTPDSAAAVWPKGQTRQVSLGPVGLTHADLEFDTGIR